MKMMELNEVKRMMALNYKKGMEEMKDQLEFAKIERRRLLEKIKRLEVAVDYWKGMYENNKM